MGKVCKHAGGDMCERCSWELPRDALLLVARGRTARTAVPVAVVVGTVLSLVNQGTVIVEGTADTGTWARVAVNYAVPFVVASIGFLLARRVRTDAADWPAYLAGYHDERPGITEAVLTRSVAGKHATPYSWLVQPLRDTEGPILDLACGSAPTRPLLAQARWFGVDASAGELALGASVGRGPLVRARADALPMGEDTIATVCSAMSLQVLTPLDAVLGEVQRVLRPGGVFVALVPSRLGIARGLFRWWRVMRVLGIRTQPWPNPQAQDGLAAILRAHGFVIDSDDRRVFRRAVTDRSEGALLVDSLYLPQIRQGRILAARRMLGNWARPGRWLPLPLRRVVAHLPDEVRTQQR
ncbi:class I SAM-dependent methyltransferase [Amycolatopsis palatopharyngis]|uniref:class I SAM-dependent methyltransferase n=1 Tax=Amycolatopsis palatopharyngis TaxID=187982 RepID=UPI001FE9E11A|nr:class I SAM-dependent methyltransferase [Amycolatopsis palatopharyngis]